MNKLSLSVAAAFFVGMSGYALAADHQVQMLNRGSNGEPMVFEPAFVKAAPGDTITFVPTDPSHNSESIAELIPEGAEGWKGQINQAITVTVSAEGLYVYRCLPHYGLGMIGLIQVGDSNPNLAAVQEAKLPGRAAERLAALLAEAGVAPAQ